MLPCLTFQHEKDSEENKPASVFVLRGKALAEFPIAAVVVRRSVTPKRACHSALIVFS